MTRRTPCPFPIASLSPPPPFFLFLALTSPSRLSSMSFVPSVEALTSLSPVGYPLQPLASVAAKTEDWTLSGAMAYPAASPVAYPEQSDAPPHADARPAPTLLLSEAREKSVPSVYTTAQVYSAIQDGSMDMAMFEDWHAGRAIEMSVPVAKKASKKRFRKEESDFEEEDDEVFAHEEEEEADEDDGDDFIEEDAPKSKPKKKTAISALMSAPKKAKNGSLTKTQRNARLKVLVTGLKQSIKSKKFYSGYNARRETCVAETVMTAAEFAEIFGSIGEIIPSKAKTSKVISKSFSAENVEEIFGTLLGALKAPTYTKPAGFQKQRKTGSEAIKVKAASCSYSTATERVKFKFECKNDTDKGGFGSCW